MHAFDCCYPLALSRVETNGKPIYQTLQTSTKASLPCIPCRRVDDFILVDHLDEREACLVKTFTIASKEITGVKKCYVQQVSVDEPWLKLDVATFCEGRQLVGWKGHSVVHASLIHGLSSQIPGVQHRATAMEINLTGLEILSFDFMMVIYSHVVLQEGNSNDNMCRAGSALRQASVCNGVELVL